MKRKRMRIYHSTMHLVTTILALVTPFILLLLFAGLEGFSKSKLLSDITVSLFRLVVSYALAAVLGWLCAVCFYRGKFSRIMLPVFDVLQSFPTFAALPLFTYLWGVSDMTVILFLVITIIWPIFFTIVSSFKLMKHDWEEAVHIFGLSGRQYVQTFLWPVSIPGLITGSIIGLGEAWEALVATEIIVGVRTGVGDFFHTYAQNPTVTVFGILGFLIIIFTINKLLWIPLLEQSHYRMEE